MSIAQSLKVKADEIEVIKKELELTQTAFSGYNEAQKKEDIRLKELVDEIKSKNTQVAEEARKIREENTRLQAENANLKKELDSRPSQEEVLQRFRGTPAYYGELNERAAEKIQICWIVASRYLAANPEGDISGFLQEYLAEEEKLLAERAILSGEVALQDAADHSLQTPESATNPPLPSESTFVPQPLPPSDA